MWQIKIKLFALFTGLILGVSTAQNTTIPDPNFEQALIDLGYDVAPINGSVLTSNISSITSLDVHAKNINNLTGIEAFLALTTLDCSENKLPNLNVSLNTKLTQLFCGLNQLTVLDVSKNTDLNIIWCESNKLSGLDVTKNIKLISLVCNNNLLSVLDVSKNTTLNVLVCENNQISTLNVSQNTTLNRFQCGKNRLLNLDVSKNLNLGFFTCENNQLSTLDVSSNPLLSTLNCEFNQLAELDISKNKSLIKINCSNNQLCRLNLNNGNNYNTEAIFSNNINLNCVVVDNPSTIPNNWIPASFSNYVSTENQCKNFVDVDTLDSVITNTSYALPLLTYGNYFTQSGGTGTRLYSGDVITTSQTIYIYNTSICASNESSFNVLITSEDYYIPKYFTPNNDGSHDFWKVQDFTNTIKTVSVFNRFGKLLKSFSSNTTGWNGMFNGQIMPCDDYWYMITLNSGETIKGHFALKR